MPYVTSAKTRIQNAGAVRGGAFYDMLRWKGILTLGQKAAQVADGDIESIMVADVIAC